MVSNRDGLSQKDRELKEFEQGFFNVDENSFDSTLAFCFDYAKLLCYYNSSNELQGRWDVFFEGDETLVLAQIIHTNIQALGDLFTDVKKTDSNEKKLSIYLNLAKVVEHWYHLLARLTTPVAVDSTKQLEQLVSAHVCKYPAFAKKITEEWKTNSSLWHINKEGIKPLLVTEFGKGYNRSFYDLIHSAEFFQSFAKGKIESSMYTKQHAPHIGLLFSFIKIFKHAQDRINTITSKHLNFYHEHVLNMFPKKSEAEHVQLIAELKNSFDQATIKRGTEFRAINPEDNSETYFRAINDFTINKIEVGKAHTLHLDRNSFISPGCTWHLVSDVSIQEIPIFKPPFQKDKNEITPLPIMGESNSNSMTSIDLGFAIASKIFSLESGRRKIIIDLHFTESSYHVLRNKLGSMASDIKLSEPEMLENFFSHLFILQISTDIGLTNISGVNMKFSDEIASTTSIQVSFQLEFDDLPVVGYCPDKHGFDLETDLPVLFFTLNKNAYVFGLSLLEAMEVVSIDIRTHVNDVRNLALYNNDGPLALDHPFYPFGSIPSVDSYLIVGCQDLVNKNIDSLKLTLEWAGLPEAGFRDHYSEYGYDMTSQSFEAQLSYLNSGVWEPGERSRRDSIKLFPNFHGVWDNRSCTQNLVLDDLQDFVLLEGGADELLPYTSLSRNGYVKMQLSSPNMLFGHKDYSTLLSETLINNSKSKHIKPHPKEPYVPILNSIHLSYSSFCRIKAEEKDSFNFKDRFYHLHPFGSECKVPLKLNETVYLLPNYDKECDSCKKCKNCKKYTKCKENEVSILKDCRECNEGKKCKEGKEGNLFLGMLNVSPSQTVSLEFILEDCTESSCISTPPAIKWSYLFNNKWIDFEYSALLYDSTSGFLKTGRVVLVLPDQIDSENTIFSKDYFWICASTKGKTNVLSYVSYIKSQALEVIQSKCHDRSTRVNQQLPAHTVEQARYPIPGIRRFYQNLDSFGGKAKETQKAMRIRCSERLAHKNRAVDAWDYEHLVLEQFPEILKVRCFENMDSSSVYKPGHVLVVVIPYNDGKNLNLSSPPTVSYPTLNEIETFLKEKTSPFVSISVRNPHYEFDQIRCTVRFSTCDSNAIKFKRLNDDITLYLTPWGDADRNTEFGKSVRGADVIAFLLKLDYIDFVTNFSMLLLSEDQNEKYNLFDSATKQTSKNPEQELNHSDPIDFDQMELFPTNPWSIILSSPKHFIEICTKSIPINPASTGIDELELGFNFIIK